jgi:putative NADH-flavin reductase
MQIIIFGATSLVGKQLVRQSLHNGHRVRAYGRNVFTEDLPNNDQLELIQGALFDADQVYKAIKGCDAVVSALGGDATGSDLTRSLGMKNIVAQMQKAGVQRIVAVGDMALLNAEDGSLLMEDPEFAGSLPVAREHLKAYGFLKNSTLDWTLVCPGDIVDADATGVFATAPDVLPYPNSSRINAGDLALFMLGELQKNGFVHHRVGISG